MIVGRFPQSEWLIDRAKLAGRFSPRVRARELWRSAQEEAGLDVVSGGTKAIRTRFATALDGIDLDNPGTALDRSGYPTPCRA